MTDLHTAAKQALEALENSIDLVEEDHVNAVNLYGKYPSRAKRLIGMETMRDDHRKAITALREALAERPAPAPGYCTHCKKYSIAEPLPAQRKPLTDEQILADEILRYHFGLNGGAGPVSKKGRLIVNAIEAVHGIKGDT